MSLYACLLATRNKLRRELKFSDDTVCITDREGRPPASGWNTFVAIHGSSWRPDEPDLNLGLSELYAFSVTLSMRVNGISQDRTGSELYVDENLETEKIIRKIVLAIHQKYDILTEADTLIGATIDDRMIEPFRWQGGDAVPQFRGSEWLKTWPPSHLVEPQEDCFLTFQLDFGGAKRVQATNDSSRDVS